LAAVLALPKRLRADKVLIPVQQAFQLWSPTVIKYPLNVAQRSNNNLARAHKREIFL
jgi:hypothetical protein